VAIATYSDLQAAIASWLNRTDLTAQIPDFITLAEARMMRKLRLRLFEQEAAVNTTTSSRTVALPADYREPLNLWLNRGNGREALNFIPASVLETVTTPGAPLYWAIDGGNLAFERPCDQPYSITFRYIQKLALSALSPTNALLTAYPDAYLTAALAEASRFLKDADAAKLWDDKHNQVAHDIREQEERTNTLTTLHTEVAHLTRRRSFDITRGY